MRISPEHTGVMKDVSGRIRKLEAWGHRMRERGEQLLIQASGSFPRFSLLGNGQGGDEAGNRAGPAGSP